MTNAAQVVVAVGVLILLSAISVTVIVYTRHIKVSVGKVEAEFRPNGGNSLKDVLSRLEEELRTNVAQLSAAVDDHEVRITKLETPRTPRKKAS